MIINLTQHGATEEQKRAGVVEPEDKKYIQHLLTFEELPTAEEVDRRARKIAIMASVELAGHDERKAMIGGAPFLMAPLEEALRDFGIVPVYAFSKRESVEAVQKDGSVVKRNIFRHMGFNMGFIEDEH